MEVSKFDVVLQFQEHDENEKIWRGSPDQGRRGKIIWPSCCWPHSNTFVPLNLTITPEGRHPLATEESELSHSLGK